MLVNIDQILCMIIWLRAHDFYNDSREKNQLIKHSLLCIGFLCGEGIFVSRVRLQCVSVDKNLTNIQHLTFFLLSSILCSFSCAINTPNACIIFSS